MGQLLTRGRDGEFIINDGATRATRAAKLAMGQLVPIEVIDDVPHWDLSKYPLVKDRLP